MPAAHGCEDNRGAVDLKAIYLTALERCAPERLVRGCIRADMPRNVVAIGKCAGALLDGVAEVHEIESAFVAVPEGYPLPFGVRRQSPPLSYSDASRREHANTKAEAIASALHIGGHPQMTKASFDAGRALLDFVDAHDDILFLVSGGGSACVEVALDGDEEHVARANAEWIASGMTIAEINARRRTLSAIKGGKLAARVRGRAVTLVYSDVSTGALHDVASGPTIPGSEAVLVADNGTLVRAAAQIIGDNAVVVEDQIESDVADAALFLADRARRLKPGQVLVAGGEPTVVVRGRGRGGRCSELAVRFAAISRNEALFGSSDGVDGNSGVAGFRVPGRLEAGGAAGWKPALREALQRSDSYPIAAQVGEPIMIAPTGNNLRDLFLVACV
jgi:glycerate 2-kinase